MTATMKAVVLTGYGEPHDVLRLDTVEKPTPTHDQVLVRVRVAAVNDWDWCYARGKPQIYRLIFGLTRPSVPVLGVDVSGVVEAVGEGVTSLAVGDEVYGDLSEAGFGGFAEYVCCRQDAWTKKPSRMTFEQAAALPHASMLALQGLVDIGKIQNGERVLINGAGGGVGVIALQIAKRHGAEVTGVDSAPKLNALTTLGFDHVIDYQTHDFTGDGQRSRAMSRPWIVSFCPTTLRWTDSSTSLKSRCPAVSVLVCMIPCAGGRRIFLRYHVAGSAGRGRADLARRAHCSLRSLRRSASRSTWTPRR
jgi:NADPH:quinone reductase-like Zn-dependent oxidoreductase